MKYRSPGPEHELLQRFIGDWTTSTRLPMFPDGEPTEGRTSFRWLMDGRFLISEGDTSMMGMPFQEAMLLGYDRFKMSYVATFLSSMDTAIRHAEGDLTRDGKTLIVYGTLDEYLTGEHDKMVKYVFRFRSDDEMVLEVHDLPIGETNTMVVEVTFTRA